VLPAAFVSDLERLATRGRSGRSVTRSARAAFDEIEGRSRHEFLSPFWLATGAWSAGLPDEALRYVKRSVAERDSLLLWGPVSPFWDGLRDHPEFRGLIAGLWC
jgi:hypothetical protein